MSKKFEISMFRSIDIFLHLLETSKILTYKAIDLVLHYLIHIISLTNELKLTQTDINEYNKHLPRNNNHW
jgi:hypothetical protein